MGKPRMIILVRHAQSEGNKNRDIHQFIPDHRVRLTPHGWTQAEEAGRTLRSMLKPDDTIQFFTSPYRRTRETTEGILRTLTADDPTPSPFPRHKIKVFEEPRLREQDFGNFQPCSAEMERMWQERADYGHFFYRIPNGESAADAYDRVSGFNESLWRQFGDEDFASVCVLVTHGLMTRIFLMKWYHWSVEYFEDLRNVNHCEFIVMKLNENGKYVLQNELRTWSELKKRAEATKAVENGTALGASPSKGLPAPVNVTSSPIIPVRRWGGCVNGCNHDKLHYPRKITRKNTADFLGTPLPPPATSVGALKGEKDDHPMASEEADHTPALADPSQGKLSRKPTVTSRAAAISNHLSDIPVSPNDASYNSCTSDEGGNPSDLDEDVPTTSVQQSKAAHLNPPNLRHLSIQGEGLSDDSDYFPGMQRAHTQAQINQPQTIYESTVVATKSFSSRSRNGVASKYRQRSRESKLVRKRTEQSWLEESGVGKGARADALGDGDDPSDSVALEQIKRTASPPTIDDNLDEGAILPEARKGDMTVENGEADPEAHDADCQRRANIDGRSMTGEDVDKMKETSRKGMDEIY